MKFPRLSPIIIFYTDRYITVLSMSISELKTPSTTESKCKKISLKNLVKNTPLISFNKDIDSDNPSGELQKYEELIEDFLTKLVNYSLGDVGFNENFYYRTSPIGSSIKI